MTNQLIDENEIEQYTSSDWLADAVIIGVFSLMAIGGGLVVVEVLSRFGV